MPSNSRQSKDSLKKNCAEGAVPQGISARLDCDTTGDTSAVVASRSAFDARLLRTLAINCRERQLSRQRLDNSPYAEFPRHCLGNVELTDLSDDV
jgi:hypothetical protein